MTRVKGGTISKARHKKVLKQAKGYFGSKHRLYRTANEQVMHSGKYAFRDRRQNEISYSKFISGLNKAEVTINRKMLSEIAIDNPKAFADLVVIAKDALNGKVTKRVAKVESSKAEAKVSPAKKTTAKKETAKKETTKKETTAKKQAAKKTTAKKTAKEDK